MLELSAQHWEDRASSIEVINRPVNPQKGECTQQGIPSRSSTAARTPSLFESNSQAVISPMKAYIERHCPTTVGKVMHRRVGHQTQPARVQLELQQAKLTHTLATGQTTDLIHVLAGDEPSAQTYATDKHRLYMIVLLTNIRNCTTTAYNIHIYTTARCTTTSVTLVPQ